ncbi:MAG: ATP-binding protein [Pseudomonadota bacterium]|nr:ATP-binding protein [Pseudomonadota bacterium]
MRRHQFVLHQTTESLPVLGDSKRLVQVIANLLNNATKYTAEGGNIRIRLEAHPDQVTLVVQDDGIGIEQELLPRVFELFTQAKRSADRSQGGLGIGLSLVKGIVELHGGSVTVESKGAGAGSKFTVLLPRHIDPRTSAPSGDDVPVSPLVKALRIMIVDDNKDAALMLSMVLDAAGYETFIEHNPHRALERARTEAPDVYMLDIGLPDMDGNELARQLRAAPVVAQPILIAITGYGQDNNRKISLEAGFDHYFVKPVDTKKLTALLTELGEALAASSFFGTSNPSTACKNC